MIYLTGLLHQNCSTQHDPFLIDRNHCQHCPLFHSLEHCRESAQVLLESASDQDTDKNIIYKASLTNILELNKIAIRFHHNVNLIQD